MIVIREYDEKYATPRDKYFHNKEEYLRIMRYCDGTLDEFEKDMWGNVIRSEYGEPSPKLRKVAKERLKDAFLEYWETL